MNRLARFVNECLDGEELPAREAQKAGERGLYPDTFLAAVEGKRSIVDEYTARTADPGRQRQLHRAVKVLAAFYSTRPGYRRRWKP